MAKAIVASKAMAIRVRLGVQTRIDCFKVDSSVVSSGSSVLLNEVSFRVRVLPHLNAYRRSQSAMKGNDNWLAMALGYCVRLLHWLVPWVVDPGESLRVAFEE